MAASYSKVAEALQDLIEAYTELDAELEEEHGDDEDAFSHAIIEILETAVEIALEEMDASTSSFATMLSSLTEAVEQLDPSAFDDDDDELVSEDYSIDEDDLDVGLDDEDLDDYGLDDDDDADYDPDEDDE